MLHQRLTKVRTGVTEKQVEKRLVQGVKVLGGVAYKFSSPGNRSVPDRLCVFPHGVVAFVECKRPGGRLTPLQQDTLNRLNQMGHIATSVSTKEGVDEFIKGMAVLLDELSARLGDNETA